LADDEPDSDEVSGSLSNCGVWIPGEVDMDDDAAGLRIEEDAPALDTPG
jgi:hypothetical protein